MNARRLSFLAVAVISIIFWAACGQVYRPVVIPCSTGGVPGCPVETNPSPANFHAVLGISNNAPGYSGEAMQLDVAGDSVIGETSFSTGSAPNAGLNPTHATILPSDSRVYVATAGSVFGGGTDSIESFNPVFQSTQGTGFGAVSTLGLPSQSTSIVAISEAANVVTVTLGTALSNLVAGSAIVIGNQAVTGYNGTFAIVAITGTTLQYVNTVTGLAPATGGTASVPPQPVFVNSTQNTAMYVANYNTNSVSAINTTSNVVVNSALVGTNPVSLAETPNGLKMYVANQGSNTVSSLNPVDLSANTVTGFTGVNPVWVLARGDSQKVYVLTQGDGQLVTIDVATDTVTSSLPVGAGANFIFFDPNLNRLYVTNPVTGMVYVFSDTGPNDTPTQLAAISMTAGANPPCKTACTPVSVTALLDGSRFYVASYQTPATCPDPTVSGACVVPNLTVFDANSMTVKYPSAPSMTLLTWPPAVPNQFAVAPQPYCATAPVYPALYSPGVPRFRMFTAAAADSSRVYVSMCDAGAIAIVNTTGANTNNSGSPLPPDTLVIDALTRQEANSTTALQPPIFLFMGQ
jgi:YVTN family beta-propeller protein